MNNESMTLSDGRILGFRCLGDPDGRPLFFFHGTPGSRLVMSKDDLIAQIPGIRLITPERPGYGISDPKPDRTLLDWAVDVAELADWLSIQTFAVAAESGGGPHALACALQLSGRVTMALLLGSPAPTRLAGSTRGMSLGNRIGMWMARYAPWLVRRMTRSYATMLKKQPERFVDAMARQMGPSDQALLAKESFRTAIIRDFQEAYRQGGHGQAVDGALSMSRDWGFDLGQIAVPVYLWHGEDDRLVSAPMARSLATAIPQCKARFLPGAGHLLTENSIVVDEMQKVLWEQAK